ncbi:hypothetical protein QQ045_002695 [Rhodiola kirilowii]
MKYSEITHHFHHPQHKLKLETSQAPFRCDGCKEMGLGSRYKCNLCDYDLHLQYVLFHPQQSTTPSTSNVHSTFSLIHQEPSHASATLAEVTSKDSCTTATSAALISTPAAPSSPWRKSKLRSQDDSKKSQFLYEKQSLAFITGKKRSELGTRISSGLIIHVLFEDRIENHLSITNKKCSAMHNKLYTFTT